MESSDCETVHKVGTESETTKRAKKHKKHKKHKKSTKSDKMDKAKKKASKSKKKRRHSKDAETTNNEQPVSRKRLKSGSGSLPPPVQWKTTTTIPKSAMSGAPGGGGSIAPVINTVTNKSNGQSKLLTNAKSSKPGIPTDPSKLVEVITKSLHTNAEPSLEIVSSESESEGYVD